MQNPRYFLKSPPMHCWLIDQLITSDKTIATMILVDIRNHIIVWHFKEQKGAPEIAQLAGCSESVVYKILALYHEYGQVTNPHACPHGRPHALDASSNHCH